MQTYISWISYSETAFHINFGKLSCLICLHALCPQCSIVFECRKLYTSPLIVKCISFDFRSSRIFWSDASHYTIQQADLDGTQRRTLVSSGLTCACMSNCSAFTELSVVAFTIVLAMLECLQQDNHVLNWPAVTIVTMTGHMSFHLLTEALY